MVHLIGGNVTPKKIILMADEELANGAGDTAITEFATYEDYLDSQITPVDLFYLEVI
jgi:hypothetical protein